MTVDELADPLGREAAPPKARDGRHPRVVPAPDMALADQSQQDALGQHGVGEVEAGELVLVGARRHRQALDEPVVERPVGLELEGAQRVRHALDRIGLAVREVVRRIDAPGVARARVRGMRDAIEDRVAQVDVRGAHVDPGAQDPRAVRELAAPHPVEQVEVLVDRPVPERAVAAGLGESAPVGADVIGRQVVDIGMAGSDQLDRPRVELLEVVGGEGQVIAPVEAEPAEVGLDSVDVLLLLLGRVGVVEAEVALPAELDGDPEIEADRLGVADVEVAVGLRWKARHDGAGPAALEVGGDDVADEVATLGRGLHGHGERL